MARYMPGLYLAAVKPDTIKNAANINTYTWCSTVIGKWCTTFSAKGHEYIRSFA